MFLLLRADVALASRPADGRQSHLPLRALRSPDRALRRTPLQELRLRRYSRSQHAPLLRGTVTTSTASQESARRSGASMTWTTG